MCCVCHEKSITHVIIKSIVIVLLLFLSHCFSLVIFSKEICFLAKILWIFSSSSSSRLSGNFCATIVHCFFVFFHVFQMALLSFCARHSFKYHTHGYTYNKMRAEKHKNDLKTKEIHL